MAWSSDLSGLIGPGASAIPQVDPERSARLASSWMSAEAQGIANNQTDWQNQRMQKLADIISRAYDPRRQIVNPETEAALGAQNGVLDLAYPDVMNRIRDMYKSKQDISKIKAMLPFLGVKDPATNLKLHDAEDLGGEGADWAHQPINDNGYEPTQVRGDTSESGENTAPVPYGTTKDTGVPRENKVGTVRDVERAIAANERIDAENASREMERERKSAVDDFLGTGDTATGDTAGAAGATSGASEPSADTTSADTSAPNTIYIHAGGDGNGATGALLPAPEDDTTPIPHVPVPAAPEGFLAGLGDDPAQITMPSAVGNYAATEARVGSLGPMQREELVRALQAKGLLAGSVDGKSRSPNTTKAITAALNADIGNTINEAYGKVFDFSDPDKFINGAVKVGMAAPQIAANENAQLASEGRGVQTGRQGVIAGQLGLDTSRVGLQRNKLGLTADQQRQNQVDYYRGQGYNLVSKDNVDKFAELVNTRNAVKAGRGTVNVMLEELKENGGEMDGRSFAMGIIQALNPLAQAEGIHTISASESMDSNFEFDKGWAQLLNDYGISKEFFLKSVANKLSGDDKAVVLNRLGKALDMSYNHGIAAQQMKGYRKSPNKPMYWYQQPLHSGSKKSSSPLSEHDLQERF